MRIRAPRDFGPRVGEGCPVEGGRGEVEVRGLPERDMESLGVMGWGLVAAENSSAAAVVAVAIPW